MDAGRPIELGTLDEFRTKYGQGILIDRRGETLQSHFFPTLEAASAALDAESDRTGLMVRPSNLEDIFVELTGRDLN
jgi:ABC-2 type transport system ATP-binding protein